MGHESDCDTLWPAPAGAACMATAPFLTWRWVAFTMHIGMSVNNSTHARIILFLLLRLIILISAKIVNFGVTQCAAATIFSVFFSPLSYLQQRQNYLQHIAKKQGRGNAPMAAKPRGSGRLRGRTGRKAGVGLPRHSRSAFTAPQPARRHAAIRLAAARPATTRAKAAAGRHHRHSPDGTRPDGRPE